MLSLIISWIMQPKNLLITILISLTLGVSIYSKVLKLEIKSDENKIESLNITISKQDNLIKGLSKELQDQNDAIKLMNNDFNTQKQNFDKKYSDLQVLIKEKNSYIEKQSNYKSNIGTIENGKVITETDATHKVLEDFLNNRGVK